MRFMIIVKANKDSEAGVTPPQEAFKAMADFHQELAQAGVLLDASGLRPSDEGFRIAWDGGKRRIIDGPFAETKELIAGYTLIQVKSREEAMEWAKRWPNPLDQDGAIEVRRLYELDELPASDHIERFRALGVGAGKK